MHTEIYTWTQKDFMGSMSENYMMWRVDQTLKHGVVFTNPTIFEKYISPGVHCKYGT
jgi:hypothetical protein